MIVHSSSFEDLRGADMRRMQLAAERGPLHLLLWSDELVAARMGRPPKFPLAERLYLAQAVRYISKVHICNGPEEETFAVRLEDLVFPAETLADFPAPEPLLPTGRKKVVVTGCYDWLHSGHLAFFEEVSALGDLHVCLGSDANIELLKGPGHPLFSATERRFLVGSIRTVAQALIASGSGWMDAEPEILNVIHPDIYAVNEDGDKPEKAAFCKRHGIEYVVLKRVPKTGLQARSSTSLRGF